MCGAIMTRDDYREKCIEAMKAAHWTAYNLMDADDDIEDYCTYCMGVAFDSLHGIARIVPLEATEDMIDAGWQLPCTNNQEPSYRDVYRAMSAAGDITTPPEDKP